MGIYGLKPYSFLDMLTFQQSMLGSVITARDRWLKPGGLILPSNATVVFFIFFVFQLLSVVTFASFVIRSVTWSLL